MHGIDFIHREAVKHQSRIVEIGSPDQLFHSPKAERTREFVSKIVRHTPMVVA